MLLKKKFLRICRDYDLFLKNKNFFYKKFFFSFLQVKSSKSINPNFDSGKKFKKLRILTYLKEIIQNIFSFSSNKITISKSSNILVLSTCINKEHLKNIDFYLGHIIKEIKKKNKITLVIRNLTNDNITIKDFKKNLKNLEIHEIRNKLNIFLTFSILPIPYSPHFSFPIVGPIKSIPIDLRYCTFFLFTGLFHIIVFIAGIKTIGLFEANIVVEAKLSP